MKDVEWWEFRIKDLFEKIEKGKCNNEKVQTKYNEKGISYLSATNRNNGVSNFVENNSLSQMGNCIMFINQGDGGAGYSVYKRENFIATTSTSFGYAKWVNKYTGLFISCVLSKFKNKYSFGYGRNENRLLNDKIMLPIDSQENHNWQFMEEYIKQKEKKLAEIIVKYYRQKMDNMIGGGVQQGSLKDVEWREFKIKDIFTARSVKGKPISNYTFGKLPYVTTSALNNGIDKFVSTNEGISDGNCISIDPIGGKAFYHKYEFVGRGGAGSAINLLYNDKLNKDIALFLCKAIEKTSLEKASYAVALNGGRLKNAKILLPIDSLGNPNWKFMESYIKNIEAKQIRKILRYLTYTYI